MQEIDRELETSLRKRLALKADEQGGDAIQPVLRRARRVLAIRNAGVFMLGRIWLALACLFAPAMTRRRRVLNR